jgi:chloride channel protein, CIC family
MVDVRRESGVRPFTGARVFGAVAARGGHWRFFLVLSLIAALFSSMVVVGFRTTIDLLVAALHRLLAAAPPQSVILVPALAGVVIAVLAVRVFPRMGGSGVNHTKAAIYVAGGYTPVAAAVGKFITSSLAIAAGYSLGPEDPALHFGAAIASFVGRQARLPREALRLIVPVGAAAGLAAAFSAPISAVLFMVEEITGSWTARTLGAAILAASSSGFVAAALRGPGPVLHIPAAEAIGPGALVGGAAIGVAGGLASVVFAHSLGRLRSGLKALPRWTRYLHPPAAGLLIGTLAYMGAPEVMGAGYEVADRAVAGQIAWQVLAALAALKILATTLSVASGTPGGLFAPTLVIGAAIGGSVGGGEHAMWPALAAAPATDALVGMSALFAGFIRAPVTAIFMAVEISADYSIVVPAMLASVLAYLISRRLMPTPILDVLGRQDGLNLPSMEEEREITRPVVEDAMRPAPAILAGHQTVDEALRIIAECDASHLPMRTAGAGWRICGREWLRLVAARGDDHVTLASICPADQPPAIHPDHSLSTTLHHLHLWPMLPVIARADGAELRGVLTLDAALRLYGLDRGAGGC